MQMPIVGTISIVVPQHIYQHTSWDLVVLHVFKSASFSYQSIYLHIEGTAAHHHWLALASGKFSVLCHDIIEEFDLFDSSAWTGDMVGVTLIERCEHRVAVP